MQIDRSNYEIWLIDYLDGNLNDRQVEELNVFLSGNTDIREEFNELASVRLKPYQKPFLHKDNLKKSPADLSVSQFEYFCVASLENDLSSSQQTELKEIVDKEPEKKRTFELIQKTRLIPSVIIYKHKNKLHKNTTVQIVMRFAVMGLSAAATIALLITTYLLITRNMSDKSTSRLLPVSAQNLVIDTTPAQPAVNKLTDKKILQNNINIPIKQRANIIAAVQKNITVLPQSDSTLSMKNASLLRNSENLRTEVTRIPVRKEVGLSGIIIGNALVASNSAIEIPVYDDERSNLSKFISKTFREKILKDKISKNSPLKGYEIAEAGVTGLNKLFGWEMALEERNDENGELRSVYFSSKMLKFNAPVKKTEPLP